MASNTFVLNVLVFFEITIAYTYDEDTATLHTI